MSTEYDDRVLLMLLESGYTDRRETAFGLDLRKEGGERVMLSGYKALFYRNGFWRPFDIDDILTLGVAEIERKVRIITNRDGEEDRTGYSLIPRMVRFY